MSDLPPSSISTHCFPHDLLVAAVSSEGTSTCCSSRGLESGSQYNIRWLRCACNSSSRRSEASKEISVVSCEKLITLAQVIHLESGRPDLSLFCLFVVYVYACFPCMFMWVILYLPDGCGSQERELESLDEVTSLPKRCYESYQHFISVHLTLRAGPTSKSQEMKTI